MDSHPSASISASLGVVPVPEHDLRPAQLDLAQLALGHLRAALDADDAALRVGDRAPPTRDRVLRAVEMRERRGLGQPVALDHRNPEPVPQLPGDDRAERGAAGPDEPRGVQPQVIGAGVAGQPVQPGLEARPARGAALVGQPDRGREVRIGDSTWVPPAITVPFMCIG